MTAFVSGHRRQDEETEGKRGRSEKSFDRTVTSADMASMPRIGRMEMLRRTIESEIIPRLMLSSRSAAHQAVPKPDGGLVRASDVLEFTDLLLDGSPSEVTAVVDRLTDQGVSQAVIMLDLFAKSARRLGELWESDDRNFAEVTLAMGVLRQAMRLLNEDDDVLSAFSDPNARKILLTPGTGEQHGFAVLILDAFFSRCGWLVETRASFDKAWIEAFVKKRHMDVVGFSISRESLLDQLASDIAVVRRKSCNPSLVVLVGGHVFFGRPELVARVGADATADDAQSAVQLAERLTPGVARAHL